MEVLKDAFPLRIEPTENGVIVHVHVAGARDPYSDMGRIGATYVFNSMLELQNFISSHFIGEVKKDYGLYYEGKPVEPIYAIDGSPVFGGGS